MKTIFIVMTAFSLTAFGEEAVQNFNGKLKNTFDQRGPNTTSQQVIYGTVESGIASGITLLLTKKERKKIQELSEEISQVEAPNNNLKPFQREARLNYLRQNLHEAESTLAKKMTNSPFRIFLRGTQVFLLAEIGSRIYILKVLNEDPGTLPLIKYSCSKMDCGIQINKLLDPPPAFNTQEQSN